MRIAAGSVVAFKNYGEGYGAIVNAANVGGLGGGGVDAAVNSAGGPRMHADRRALPILNARNERIRVGGCVATGPNTYDAIGTEFVLHAVGFFFRVKTHKPAKMYNSKKNLSGGRKKKSKTDKILKGIHDVSNASRGLSGGKKKDLSGFGPRKYHPKAKKGEIVKLWKQYNQGVQLSESEEFTLAISREVEARIRSE